MPRPKLATNVAYKAEIVQTLTGIAANSTATFTLSARGAQTDWFYQVASRALPASFVISHAFCSVNNGVAVTLANITGASAAIGSQSFSIVAV